MLAHIVLATWGVGVHSYHRVLATFRLRIFTFCCSRRLDWSIVKATATVQQLKLWVHDIAYKTEFKCVALKNILCFVYLSARYIFLSRPIVNGVWNQSPSSICAYCIWGGKILRKNDVNVRPTWLQYFSPSGNRQALGSRSVREAVVEGVERSQVLSTFPRYSVAERRPS